MKTLTLIMLAGIGFLVGCSQTTITKTAEAVSLELKGPSLFYRADKMIERAAGLEKMLCDEKQITASQDHKINSLVTELEKAKEAVSLLKEISETIKSIFGMLPENTYSNAGVCASGSPPRLSK